MSCLYPASYTHLQLNKKGNELLKDIRGGKHVDNVANDIPIYIRYLKASLMDFEGKTNKLKYYLLSFYLTSALFMAFTPQFYGYILPLIFLVPIFLGVRAVSYTHLDVYKRQIQTVPVFRPSISQISLW